MSVDLKALRRELPSLPFVAPPPAAARARQLQQSSTDGSFSSQEVREQVRSCFECEATGIQLALCMYEVTARDHLMEDERYQVQDERGRVIGCKLFCPGGCCSNKLVLVDGVNLDHDTSIRFAYGNGSAILPVSRAYVCCNPDCPAVVAKSDEVSLQLLRNWTKDGLFGQSAKGKWGELKKLGAHFYGHDTRVMLALPRRVRAMYRGLLCWKQGGCDDEFAERILKSKAKLAELEADMQATARGRYAGKALEDYLAFVRMQHTVHPPAERFFGAPPSAPVKWPLWRLQQMTNSLLHATAHNIRVTLIEYHRLLRPYLLGDMIRRSLGRGASSDGTFRSMLRTKTDGQVLYLIIGEDGCIVAYYVLQSESWKELEPGLKFLNSRLERLGTIEELEEWWSDRCCDGAADPTKHVLPSIFPKSKLKRAPRKDRFHAINGVNKTGNEGVLFELVEDRVLVGLLVAHAHQHGRLELGHLDECVGLVRRHRRQHRHIRQGGAQVPNHARPVVLDRVGAAAVHAAVVATARANDRLDLVDLVGSTLLHIHGPDDAHASRLEAQRDLQRDERRNILRVEALLGVICARVVGKCHVRTRWFL